MAQTLKRPPLAPTVPVFIASRLPAGYVREEQARLDVGPFTLVLADRHCWALPGGGRARREELAALSRRCGWRAPTLYHVTLTRRI